MIPSLVPNRFNGLNSHWVFLLWVALCTCSITKVAAAPPSLTPQQRQRYENDLARWKGLLNEYHQGKRDENDGGAILFNLLHDYGVLGSSTTAEAVEAVNEWHALLKKHPEFKAQMPQLHEEIEAAKAREKAQQDLADKANNFVPKDSRILRILGHDRKMALVYQYHVAFFQLPTSMRLERDSYSNLLINVNGQSIRDYAEIANLNLKPTADLVYRHRIKTALDNHTPTGAPEFIFLCEDFLGTYSASDQEESEVLSTKYPGANGQMSWVNAAASQDDFCGAVSLDGKVLYELPIKQHLPDTLISLRHTNQNGSSIQLQVGELVESTVDEEHAIDLAPGEKVQHFGNVRQTIIFTFPDKIEIYDATNTEKLSAAMKAHEF